MIGRGLGLLRGASSGWCVRCSPHSCLSVVRGPSHWRRESAGPPFSRLSRPGEHLTHQPLLGPLRRPKPRPTTHSPLTKQAAVARATAGKVLASRCWPAGTWCWPAGTCRLRVDIPSKLFCSASGLQGCSPTELDSAYDCFAREVSRVRATCGGGGPFRLQRFALWFQIMSRPIHGLKTTEYVFV